MRDGFVAHDGKETWLTSQGTGQIVDFEDFAEHLMV